MSKCIGKVPLDVAGRDSEPRRDLVIPEAVARAQKDESTIEAGDLLKGADAQLYKAKEGGRNRLAASSEPEFDVSNAA